MVMMGIEVCSILILSTAWCFEDKNGVLADEFDTEDDRLLGI